MINKLLTDKILAGVILGFISNIPKQIIDLMLHYLGGSKFFCWHITGGVLLSANWLNTGHGLFIGAVTDFFFAAILGVSMVYFLYFFGANKYLFIKGVGFSIFMWYFLCIIFVDQRISMYQKLTDPVHAYQSFGVHTTWGLVMALSTCYLCSRYY